MDHGEARYIRSMGRTRTARPADNIPTVQGPLPFLPPRSQPTMKDINGRDMEGADQNGKLRRASARTKSKARRVSIHRFLSNLFRLPSPDTPLSPSIGENVTADCFSHPYGGNLRDANAEMQHVSFHQMPTAPRASSPELHCPRISDSVSLIALPQSVSQTDRVITQFPLSKFDDQRTITRTSEDARSITWPRSPATLSDSLDMNQSLPNTFIMEPLPGPTWSSCSEENNWYHASTPTAHHSAGREAAHEDPRRSSGMRPPTSLPATPLRSAPMIMLLSSFIDHGTWKALRLTCRDCYNHLTRVRPPQMSAVYSLPTELLQQIYSYLGPADYEAARHTCHAWMQASLYRSLLTAILKRGGWASAALRKVLHNPPQGDHRSANCHFTGSPLDRPCLAPSDLDWVLSRHLSRECSLRPDWTGNGLIKTFNNSHPLATSTSFPAEIVEDRCSRLRKPSRFVLFSTMDFSELSPSLSAADECNCGLLFTVSTCGGFILVADGCLIYPFELLSDGNMWPLASVVCPRRVLAMSMDASSGRFALAALMDGRMGLVCDLQKHSERRWPTVSSEDDLECASGQREKSGSQILDNTLHPSGLGAWFSRSRQTVAGEPLPAFLAPNASNLTVESVNSIESVGPLESSNLRARKWPLHVDRASTLPCIRSPHAARIRETTAPVFGSILGQTSRPCDFSSRIDSRNSPSSGLSTYRGLCSNDDPPRSVAICPSQRCVAFGCSSGIELHWVDAVSSRDLNRWFPLTAASDHLYFLPPRLTAGESAKRLRIISSTVAPNTSPAVRQRFAGRDCYRRNQTPSLPYDIPDCGSQLPAQHSGKSPRVPPPHGVTFAALDNDFSTARWASGITVNRSNGCDHYRAVPVSDGYHILFTDPATNQVCLGTDAPIGGPTKLLKRVILVSPLEAQGAIVYASGRDLKWGLRVTASYGEHLVLFSVPPDVLEASRFADIEAKADPSSHSARTSASAPKAQEHRSEDGSQEEYPEWYEHWPGRTESSDHGYPIFPLRLQCVDVGRVKGIVDLAISGSGADFAIWAFSADGVARTWKVSGRAEHCVKERIVAQDGRVLDRYDYDGDALMLDAYTAGPNIACTMPREEPTPALPNAMLDEDGDYRMRDADSIDDENYLDGATDLETIDEPPAGPVQNMYRLDGASDVLARAKTILVSRTVEKEDIYWGCTKYGKVKTYREAKGRRRSRRLSKSAAAGGVQGEEGPAEKFTVWCSVHRVYRDEEGVFWFG